MSVQITPELLDELESKAKAATPGPLFTVNSTVYSLNAENVNRIWAQFQPGWTDDKQRNSEEECVATAQFVAAANPTTILALVQHIRSLTERLEKAVTDQARYHWLVHQGDSYQWMNIIKVDPDDFESYEEAIDAAIAKEGQNHE